MSKQRPRPASAAGRLGGGRPRSSDVFADHPELRSQLDLIPAACEWQRAQVDGCIKKPVLRSDEAKLKELFVCCREANYREVRAIAFHFPWLLAMTDSYGFTALHHAEMSGNAEFMAKLLELYNEPRAFARKFVKYECEQDLRLDGFRLQSNRPSIHSQATPATISNYSRPSTESERVVVRLVAPNSIASAAGVVPGDTLESVQAAPIHGRHIVNLTPEDVSDVMLHGARLEEGYPLTLEFMGPASAEILGRNHWTPLHAAAGGGAHYKKVCRLLRQEQQKLPTAVHDGHGCTPEHWRLISKRSTSGPRRRPLSAGPCPHRRPSLAARQRTLVQDGERAYNSPGRRARPPMLPRAPPPPSP